MVECTKTLEELSVCRNWLSANGALRVVEAVARRFAHGAQDEPEVAERMVQRKSFRWKAKQCFADLTIVASTTTGALSKARLVATEDERTALRLCLERARGPCLTPVLRRGSPRVLECGPARVWARV